MFTAPPFNHNESWLRSHDPRPTAAHSDLPHLGTPDPCFPVSHDIIHGGLNLSAQHAHLQGEGGWGEGAAEQQGGVMCNMMGSMCVLIADY